MAKSHTILECTVLVDDPLCGYKGKHAGTIMDTNETAYKRVRINPRYKFWKPQFKRVWADAS